MTLWRDARPLILASASDTRRQLLASTGIPVEICPADVDERALEADLHRDLASPADVARTLARAKAASVSSQWPDHWIVGADQTLALGLMQFHKPSGAAQASEQLRALSGKTHHLYSAICLYRNGVCRFEDVMMASLSMRRFSDAFLATYLETAGEAVTRSVGAYQIEGLGIHLFDRIEGDHQTILGLPLLPLLAYLRSEGAVES